MIIFLFADFTYKYCVQFYQYDIVVYFYKNTDLRTSFCFITLHVLALHQCIHTVQNHHMSHQKYMYNKVCSCINMHVCQYMYMHGRSVAQHASFPYTPKEFCFLGVNFQRDIQIATEMHFHVTFRRSYPIFNTFIISLL